MLTTDAIYWKGYQPKIEIKDLGNSTTYYTFDPFNDVTTNKVVYAKIDLGMDHHGLFEVQIEDANLGLDTTNIKAGQRVIMSLKKDASLSYNLLISGLIRKTGYTRGRGGEALYNLIGSSTAIRFNELIMNEALHAALLDDGITIDPTDANFKADTLLQNTIGAALTNDGVITAANLAANSDVETFIPSLKVTFGELQEGCNIVEDITGAEVFVGPDDIIVLRSRMQPFVSGRGFILKDIQGNQDDADITGYIDGTPEYFESYYKSDSYSNQLYALLPAETVPTTREEMGYGSALGGEYAQTTTTGEWAQKFRPPHSHFITGDIIILGHQIGTAAPWSPRFRICTDNAGVPTNAGGIIVNINFPITSFPDPIPGSTNPEQFTVLSDQLFYDSSNTRIDSFNLDTTHDYWLISSNDNIPSSNGFNWAVISYLNGAAGVFQNTSSLSTNSAGGSGWTVNVNELTMGFAIPRRRSQAFECADPKAIASVGSGLGTILGNRIASTLTNLPPSIITREALQKYLINQMYLNAKPQVRWSNLVVSSPNIPILPNDPLLIVDSTLGFSTAGNLAQVATTGNMSYQFGERGGDGNNLVSGMYLNIEPVGYATHY